MKQNRNNVIYKDAVRHKGLYFSAILVIIIAFFVICRCGFFLSDDYWMGGNCDSFRDVITDTAIFYLTWGGGLFSAFSQYLFCGLMGDDKLWFDIADTIVFVCLLLACLGLVSNERKGNSGTIDLLWFALLFWFLCPEPCETLFWAVGSIGYLWSTTLVFLFLLCFMKNKDVNSSIWIKLLLFVFSVFMAASLIPCVSVCGAFVVYYLLHHREFKGNAVFLVTGFVIGTLVLLLAPGNFARASVDMISFSEKIKDLIAHPIREIMKYKALWLFVFSWLLVLCLNKRVAQDWARKNLILLLVLGWSVVAFSIVFRPANRALFFTETMSIILFMRLIQTCPQGMVRFPSIVPSGVQEVLRSKGKFVTAFFLFVLFLFDAGWAMKETRRQRVNNQESLKRIVEGNGFAAVDVFPSSHRMAFGPSYPIWSWEGMANRFGLDTVSVFPYYCMDKYYSDTIYNGKAFVDQLGLLGYGDESIRDQGMVFVRNENIDGAENHRAIISINYSRPRKWYIMLVERLHGYEYDRRCVVEKETPDLFFSGYDYYVIWMKKENLKGIKDIEIGIDGDDVILK